VSVPGLDKNGRITRMVFCDRHAALEAAGRGD
jgi:hypothetical protein